MACHKAARVAVKLGYSNVWVMPKGLDGWKEAGLPTDPPPTPKS